MSKTAGNIIIPCRNFQNSIHCHIEVALSVQEKLIDNVHAWENVKQCNNQVETMLISVHFRWLSSFSGFEKMYVFTWSACTSISQLVESVVIQSLTMLITRYFCNVPHTLREEDREERDCLWDLVNARVSHLLFTQFLLIHAVKLFILCMRMRWQKGGIFFYLVSTK